MYWLVALMSLAILGLIVSGILLETRPQLSLRVRPWYRPAMGTQLLNRKSVV
jgi:V/A-type H+-transporting ATPase subunit K